MNIFFYLHLMFCKILSCFFRTKTIRHILTLNFKEQKVFLRKIIDKNIFLTQNNLANDSTIADKSLSFVRNYNQMPCTIETRLKRANLLEENNHKEKSILLIGDDDEVSVELAKRGFKYVTVLDCDTKLLERLKILCKDSQYTVRFLLVDLYVSFPRSLEKAFDVVCFDPPQNYSELNIFLKCALLSVKDYDSYIYMMINSDSIGKEGTIKTNNYLMKYGFLRLRKLDYFNIYPLNRGQSLLLKAVSFLTHSFKERAKGVICKYYFTDCIEFKRISNENAVGLDIYDSTTDLSSKIKDNPLYFTH